MVNNDDFVKKDHTLENYTGSDELINKPKGVKRISKGPDQRQAIKVVNLLKNMVKIRDDAFNG